MGRYKLIGHASTPSSNSACNLDTASTLVSMSPAARHHFFTRYNSHTPEDSLDDLHFEIRSSRRSSLLLIVWKIIPSGTLRHMSRLHATTCMRALATYVYLLFPLFVGITNITTPRFPCLLPYTILIYGRRNGPNYVRGLHGPSPAVSGKRGGFRG